jgi:hypothetical protein
MEVLEYISFPSYDYASNYGNGNGARSHNTELAEIITYAPTFYLMVQPVKACLSHIFSF